MKTVKYFSTLGALVFAIFATVSCAKPGEEAIHADDTIHGITLYRINDDGTVKGGPGTYIAGDIDDETGNITFIIPRRQWLEHWRDEITRLKLIATVEYIPLETREGFLLSEYSRVQYMDDRIAIFTNSKEDIMIFDRKSGKGVTSFNRLGRGPGEYTMIGGFAVDGARGEIFVRDGNRLPVYVYDMEGKHLRTLEFKRNPYTVYLHDWDDDHLFVYNAYNPLAEWNRQKPDSPLYRLISKTDTVITDLPVRFGGANRERESMTLRHYATDEGGGYMDRGRGDFLAKTADGYVVSEPGLDTIYRWNKNTGDITPLAAQIPSFHSFEYPVGLFYEGESSGWLFVQTIERRLGGSFSLQDILNRGLSLGGFETVHLALDKSDGAIYRARLLNADFADARKLVLANNFGVPASTFVFPLQPYELIDQLAEGELTGRLAEIAAGLKEDDNPVMMIATFKR